MTRPSNVYFKKCEARRYQKPRRYLMQVKSQMYSHLLGSTRNYIVCVKHIGLV
ncbi:hypothetical protein Hanom_Chr12g01097171 [Helianthus anomalus]